MMQEEPTAREQWPAGQAFEPHDGETTDANYLYADLLAGPDENHPDPMAGYVAPTKPQDDPV
jgi:hypothetical protein